MKQSSFIFPYSDRQKVIKNKVDLYFEFIQGNVKYKKSSLSVIGQKHIASHRSKSTLSLPELEQTKTKKNNIRLKRIKIIQSNKMDNDCQTTMSLLPIIFTNQKNKKKYDS